MSKKTKTTEADTNGTPGATPRTRKPRDPNAPAIKRPRAGSWTPVVRTYQIPETDLSIDVEMYSVEFAGETLEVKRDRAGVAKANAWIKGIREREERLLKIDRLRRELAAMEGMGQAEPGNQTEGPTTENHPTADGEPTA